MPRGTITHRKRAKQLVNFTGLRYERGITPTDIDGFIDFDGRLFVFIELKYASAPTPAGQKRALLALVDACSVPAIAIFAYHYQEDPEKDIDAATSQVAAYYQSGVYTVNKRQWLTVRYIIGKFRAEHEKRNAIP